IVGWVLIGAVVGLLGGLIAVHLTDQAMCPHAILGPCSTLTSRGRGEIVILGVVVGAIAARAGACIGGARTSREPQALEINRVPNYFRRRPPTGEPHRSITIRKGS